MDICTNITPFFPRLYGISYHFCPDFPPGIRKTVLFKAFPCFFGTKPHLLKYEYFRRFPGLARRKRAKLPPGFPGSSSSFRHLPLQTASDQLLIAPGQVVLRLVPPPDMREIPAVNMGRRLFPLPNRSKPLPGRNLLL